MSRDQTIVIGLSCARGAVRALAVSLTGRVVSEVRGDDAHEALRQCDVEAAGLGVAADQPIEAPGVSAYLSPAVHGAVAGSGVAEPSTMVILTDERPVVCMLNSRVKQSVADTTGPLPDAIVPGYLGYRFTLDDTAGEELAFALRRRVEQLREAGIPVRRFVAAGEDAAPDTEAIQTIADALRERVFVDPQPGVLARGAAALAAAATHRFPSQSMAIHAIADPDRRITLRPNRRRAKRLDAAYRRQ